MALANAVKGARHTPQTITWTDDDDTAVILTGATLTGFIQQGGVTRAIDGTLALVTAASGIFSWTYGANDVGTAGEAIVNIVATFADTTEDISYMSAWYIHDTLSL